VEHLLLSGEESGRLGFDYFDAAVTVADAGNVSLVGVGEQKEAKTKENDHDCCRNNAERDEVEPGADIEFQRPGALVRGTRGLTQYFGEVEIGGPGCASPREL